MLLLLSKSKFEGFLLNFSVVVPFGRTHFFDLERQGPEVDRGAKGYFQKNEN
jgi:hypothetical protein